MMTGLAKEVADKESEKYGRCESCNENAAALIITDLRSGKAYRVCHNCIIELVNVSLTPEHFFNMLKAGHSKHEFWLHDDFYDWNIGEALQPKL